MKCSACGKNKSDVSARKSRLALRQTLFLCPECVVQKREPRYMIIIHGRAHGFDSVAPYIKQRRYVGDDILAQEFV